MQLRYVIVDVFTNQRFGGNPLAVVLDAQGLSGEQMQKIAREFNYSETTFVLPPERPGPVATVRIFFPRNEIPFAGHPNVGTGFVIARQLHAAKGLDRLLLDEAAGTVAIEIMREGGDVKGAWMTAPQPLTIASQVSPEAFAAALNLDASDIDTSLHQPEVMTVGLPFIVAKLHSRGALRRATPNLDKMGRLLPRDGADGVYIYTQDVDSNDGACDFSARMFAPFSGVIEDAATGSATAAIAARLAMMGSEDVWEQTFAQGIDLGRPSRLAARVTRRNGQIDLIQVGGNCVQVMQGTLDVTPD